MQKGLIGMIVLILIALLVFLVLSYMFLAKPYKASGDKVPISFKLGELIFSEKITYLFRKPAAGDRVIFFPETVLGDRIGIITKVENKDNGTIYTIISTGKGVPWQVSTDKIKGRIYFPFLNSTIKTTIASLLLPTPSPSSNLKSTSPDETTNWKTYTHTKYGYMFKHPPGMIIRPFDSTVPVEDSSIIFIGTADNSGNGIMINSRSYQKKTSFVEAFHDLFASEPNKAGINTSVDNHPAFFTSSEGETNIKDTLKEKYKIYTVLIQQDEYNYKILSSNYIFSNKNEQDKIIFDQILSTFKFTN